MHGNERMETFLETLTKEPPAHLRELEQDALKKHVPIVSRQTWALLRFVIRIGKPLRILEIGTAIGYSALLMSEACGPECVITTIEKVPERIGEAKKNIKKYGSGSRIRLLEGDADDVLKQLAVREEGFDLIFLDAAKGQYKNFLPLIEKLLRTEGFLVADNVFGDGDVLESRYAVTRRDRTIHGRMREFLYALTKNEKWETFVSPVGDGMTVSRWLGE